MITPSYKNALSVGVGGAVMTWKVSPGVVVWHLLGGAVLCLLLFVGVFSYQRISQERYFSFFNLSLVCVFFFLLLRVHFFFFCVVSHSDLIEGKVNAICRNAVVIH